MGRTPKGTAKLETVSTALSKDEIAKIDKSSTVGTRSAKIRDLILKGLKA